MHVGKSGTQRWYPFRCTGRADGSICHRSNPLSPFFTITECESPTIVLSRSHLMLVTKTRIDFGMPQTSPLNSDPIAALPASNPFRARYTKIAPLSSGSFGFVILYSNNVTKEHIAIKFLERGENITKYVEGEILNHRVLRHPHVIEFKEVFLTPDYICIAMEYASSGNLFNYVKQAVRLKEAAARWFFQQLIIGLDYCHKMGIFNRDIKLENTLLQMVPGLPLPLLKVCDFGYSKSQHNSAPKSKVGTMAYMAPEVLKNEGNYKGDAADIWSCGVMLYVMLFGRYPFDAPPPPGGNGQDMRSRQLTPLILAGKWAAPPDIPISPQCHDLLKQLLVPDPERRLKMDQISTHAWFQANLPADALAMNDDCLRSADYTGVQSEEEIRRLMREAQAAPNKYSFGAVEEPDYSEMMDEEIDANMEESRKARGIILEGRRP